jgi:hypothetical protein
MTESIKFLIKPNSAKNSIAGTDKASRVCLKNKETSCKLFISLKSLTIAGNNC